ncbi:MAG: Zn-dependent dipeptidase [Rhodobacteraceae bacterium HLUCCA09]|nr:MAG: Zn-dependent dipeptidase [Rhodobacteraceae bacterium HLUCCA09]
MGRIVRGLLVLVLVLAALAVVAATAVVTIGPGMVERGRNAIAPGGPWPVSDEAAALHDSLVIGDWHADTLLWNRDLLERGGRGHVDLPRLIEGNVAVQVFTAVTRSPAGQNYEENQADAFDNITPLAMGQLWPPRTWGSLLERALYQAGRLERAARASEGRLAIIRDEADLDAVLAARERGETVVGGLLGIEGAHALEGDLANLDRLTEAGYRLVGLTHFFDNEVGGSLHGQGNRGLTDMGRALVAEIARRGLILDLAHASPAVAREVIARTDIPLVVSHTGIRSHCDTPRNFPDDLMRRIVGNGAAAGGGVVGIGFWADVTCDASPAGVASAIRAAIDLLGEDHVSLGSDWDGSVTVGFDAAGLPALTHAMREAGLTEAQIRKVAGENMLRVLRTRLP